ncbi:sulfite exporter TauE/SafE family protein [Streptomyces sp. DSM 42041]|uniref:Probable membrane transporter protein n=1 Tax=Streptomyces hazeniae TaxID=3075538 RepID=A0ABU2NMU4_9ACTN|nr:sulfite exporter TauE/SafE family protein [Streptomyces sp. DSM 42041]MDT0378296.1 sulfite exporter TauE/SafE family protein [Streptomyces sp. DSM 42041]
MPSVDLSWLMIVAGALVGISVGLTGMGGGALMTPIMVLVFGVNPTAAVGSDLAASVAMKPVGAYVHHKAGTVRWDIVKWLLPTAVPAGFAGAWLISLFGEGEEVQHRLELAIGAALLLALAGMVARSMLTRRRNALPSTEPTRLKPVPTLIVGLVGGLVVGVTSVGSGSLIIVMLMLTHPRLRAQELVGTDLVQAIPLVASAALGHLLFGDAKIALVGTVLLGAIPGIYLGAKLATRTRDDVLTWILATLLLGSALSLWGAPGPVILIACGALVAFASFRMFAVPALRRRREAAGAGAAKASGHTATDPDADADPERSEPTTRR